MYVHVVIKLFVIFLKVGWGGKNKLDSFYTPLISNKT